jgi:hypothetical protein
LDLTKLPIEVSKIQIEEIESKDKIFAQNIELSLEYHPLLKNSNISGQLNKLIQFYNKDYEDKVQENDDMIGQLTAIKKDIENINGLIEPKIPQFNFEGTECTESTNQIKTEELRKTEILILKLEDQFNTNLENINGEIEKINKKIIPEISQKYSLETNRLDDDIEELFTGIEIKSENLIETKTLILELEKIVNKIQKELDKKETEVGDLKTDKIQKNKEINESIIKIIKNYSPTTDRDNDESKSEDAHSIDTETLILQLKEIINKIQKESEGLTKDNDAKKEEIEAINKAIINEIIPKYSLTAERSDDKIKEQINKIDINDENLRNTKELILTLEDIINKSQNKLSQKEKKITENNENNKKILKNLFIN